MNGERKLIEAQKRYAFKIDGLDEALELLEHNPNAYASDLLPILKKLKIRAQRALAVSGRSSSDKAAKP